MEKSSLKLHEYYTLEAELNGVVNQQTGQVVSKGLLSEKIKLTTKYWITDLAKKINSQKNRGLVKPRSLILIKGKAGKI